jgi:hypothetical protein
MSKVSTLLKGIAKTQSALQALQAISGKDFITPSEQRQLELAVQSANLLLSSLSTRRPSRITSSSRKRKT